MYTVSICRIFECPQQCPCEWWAKSIRIVFYAPMISHYCGCRIDFHKFQQVLGLIISYTFKV